MHHEFRFPDPPSLPEHLIEMREQVSRFVKREIIPAADQWEREGRIPREIYRKLGAMGLLGMRLPVEHGGTDLGPLATVVFAEELARCGYGGVTASITVHTDMSACHIALRGTAEQKRRYLPAIVRGELVCSVAVTEPDAGSDVAGLRTRARRDGGDWVIDGAKMFITNAVYGDVMVLAARTEAETKGSRGISLFIVERDRPGITATKLDKHGWLASDTAALAFDSVRVPADALLGEPGRGFYSIMETFQNERLCIGAICAGESARAIELTLDYVRQRKAFGGVLWSQQVVRNKIAGLASKAAAARALTYQTAELVALGRDCVREVSMIKALAPEVQHEVVHGCLQLHGGAGFMRGTPIERMARDARVLPIGGGATEVMLEEVAKRM